jgi:hypothetical protein
MLRGFGRVLAVDMRDKIYMAKGAGEEGMARGFGGGDQDIVMTNL